MPVAAATMSSSVPAMTTWMVVAANGLPVAFESWVLAPACTASRPPASRDRRDEQGFHDTTSMPFGVERTDVV